MFRLSLVSAAQNKDAEMPHFLTSTDLENFYQHIAQSLFEPTNLNSGLLTIFNKNFLIFLNDELYSKSPSNRLTTTQKKLMFDQIEIMKKSGLFKDKFDDNFIASIQALFLQ